MKKYLFLNDYSEGAHLQILEALAKTSTLQEVGYGDDSFSNEARKLIRDAIKNPSADVHFVSGGTQANLIVLAALLKPFESIISANSGHINTHEAGAVEATGHKIDSIESKDGKITVDAIKEIVELHEDEHMVKPRVVFISNATEVGTVYTKSELESLSKYCKENGLYLYLDGARIGSALTSDGADLTLADITRLVDIYYIGGTKNGALLGEAIVIVNKDLQSEFRRHLKQRGALLAKGRILGVQFQELFKNNLFLQLAEHSNKMAAKLAEGIKKLGIDFLTNSTTNQIFPILPDSVIKPLQELYGFYVWSKADGNRSSIRLVTSWATKKEAVDEFLSDLERLTKEYTSTRRVT